MPHRIQLWVKCVSTFVALVASCWLMSGCISLAQQPSTLLFILGAGGLLFITMGLIDGLRFIWKAGDWLVHGTKEKLSNDQTTNSGG